MTHLQKVLQEMVNVAVANGEAVDFRWALAEFNRLAE